MTGVTRTVRRHPTPVEEERHDEFARAHLRTAAGRRARRVRARVLGDQLPARQAGVGRTAPGEPRPPRARLVLTALDRHRGRRLGHPGAAVLARLDLRRTSTGPKPYGTVPDRADVRNLSPRGSIRAPHQDQMPVIEAYTVLDKYEVWADNVSTLYEEAKARQWNSTTDIPWTELEPVSEDLEKAACQFATFLTEVEFVAGDFPARWIHKIPAGLLRGEELPRHADDGRGAAHGGLPQARPVRRRRTAARQRRVRVGDEGHPRGAHPHDGHLLPQRARRGVRAVHLPSGRVPREDLRRTARSSGAACRTRPDTSPTGPWS